MSTFYASAEKTYGKPYFGLAGQQSRTRAKYALRSSASAERRRLLFFLSPPRKLGGFRLRSLGPCGPDNIPRFVGQDVWQAILRSCGSTISYQGEVCPS